MAEKWQLTGWSGVALCVVMLWAAPVPVALAQLSPETPETEIQAQALVQRVTERLLELSRTQIKSDGDNDLFFTKVSAALTGAVDFTRFSHGVMGVYANAESLADLPPVARKHRRAQIEQFTEVFISGLVRNYGGIFLTVLRLGDIEVETQPVKAPSRSGKVTVEQLVFGAGTAVPIRIYYRLQYRQSDKRWELLNIAVDKLNFGKLFRSQFYSLAAQYQEDLDQVIGDWANLGTGPAKATHSDGG